MLYKLRKKTVGSNNPTSLAVNVVSKPALESSLVDLVNLL